VRNFKGDLVKFLAYFFLIFIIVSIPYFIHGYKLRFLTLTWIFAISVLGLRLLHIVGEISFAHVGFMAIGAYTSSLLTLKLGLGVPVTLIIACISCAILGLALGYISMKLTGAYFFTITFALNYVIVLLLIRLKGITQGFGGLSDIPPPSQIFLTSPVPYYYLTGFFLLAIFFITEFIDRSNMGMLLRGIRQAPVLAESIGVNILKRKAYCLAVSCFIAGLSGCLYAHYVRFINPDCFSMQYMMDILTSMMVGGSASGWGSILGTLVVRSIAEAVGGLKQYELILSSGLLLIVMVFLREGIISLPRKIFLRQKAR
jgi:branched-chain amino acid transport system permease protein